MKLTNFMNFTRMKFIKSLTDGSSRLYVFGQMSTFVHHPIPNQGIAYAPLFD